MYCENCGKLIEAGNKFCPYCGTKLVGTEEKVEEEISHEIRTDEIPEQEIPKRSTMQDNMEEKQVNQRESTEEKTVQKNSGNPKGAVIENPGVPKKQSHLIRNVVIAVAALCVVGYAVSRSQNKNKLSQEKIDIITELKENAPLQSEYFEQWDGTIYSFCNGDKWKIKYSDENVSVRITEPEIQECLSGWFDTDNLGNDGTFAYIFNKNQINIYLDVDTSEGNISILMYDVGKDEYTLMSDGDTYYISDELKDYLNTYGLSEILLDDVDKFRTDISSMDLTVQDILKLDNTDIEKYLAKDK